MNRRVAGVLIIIMLLLAVAFIAPAQLPTNLVKVSMATVGGIVGFWIDRMVFPYAGPADFLEVGEYENFRWSSIRRALIIASTVLAVCLGM